jgi:hypothetical protein
MVSVPMDVTPSRDDRHRHVGAQPTGAVADGVHAVGRPLLHVALGAVLVPVLRIFGAEERSLMRPVKPQVVAVADDRAALGAIPAGGLQQEVVGLLHLHRIDAAPDLAAFLPGPAVPALEGEGLGLPHRLDHLVVEDPGLDVVLRCSFLLLLPLLLRGDGGEAEQYAGGRSHQECLGSHVVGSVLAWLKD